MNVLVMAVAIAAGVALEALLPFSWTLGRTRAPVLLGVAAYYALNRNRGMMLASAAAGGLLRDAVIGLPPGCSAVGLVLIGWTLHSHRASLFGKRLTTRLALGLVSGATFSLSVYLMLLAVVGLDLHVSAPEALSKAFGEGLWGALVVPPTLAALEMFERMVGNVGMIAHDPC